MKPSVAPSFIQETKRPEFTEAGEPLEWAGKFSGGFNRVNNGRYGALYNGIATEQHRLHVYGSKETGDDFKFPGGRNIPTRHDREAAEVGYGFRHEAHVLDVDFNYNFTRPTGTPALPMDIIMTEGGVLTAGYQGRIGDEVGIKAAFNYQDVRHTMDNFSIRRTPATGKRFSRNTADGFGYRLMIDFPLLGGRTTVGVDGDNATHNATITNPDAPAFFIKNFNDAQRDRYGFFGEYALSPLQDWTIELGARVNYIVMNSGRADTHFQTAPWRALVDNFNNRSRSRNDVNYDLTGIVRHHLSESLEIELGFARKTRSPSYQQRFLWAPLDATGGLADGFLYIGNLDLKPETSYQGELGLTWRQGTFYAAPRAFYRYVNNYIQGIPTSNPNALAIAGAQQRPLLQYANIDAILYGGDVEAGFRFLNHWRVDGTLSYVRGQRDDAKDNLYRIAPLNGLLSLFYESTKWTLGTEVVGYWRQRKVSKFNDEPTTAGYALWHIRSQVEVIRGLQVGAGVENLLNKDYRVHLNGLNRALDNVASGIGIGERLPGIGRNFYVTMNYEW